MPRKNKQDWLTAGIIAFAKKGPAGLTIDGLAQQLGVTKGSFYHHFESQAAFKKAFLLDYAQKTTPAVIDRLKGIPTSLEQLHELLRIIIVGSAEVTFNVENMIRAWAMHDSDANAMQTSMDSQRIAYVQALLGDLLVDDEVSAERASQLFYATLVGAQQMHPPITGDALSQLFNTVLTLFKIEIIR